MSSLTPGPLASPHALALFVALASFASAIAVPVVAQPRRLSPLEALSVSLRDDIRIEAADSAAGVTIGVFGSYVRDLDDVEGHRALMAARVDRAGAGVPVAITSRDARPTSLVRVVARSGGSTVIWSDRRRGAEGLYARRLDAQGGLVGEEEMILPGSVEELVTEPLHPRVTVVLRRDEAPAVLDDEARVIARGVASLRSPHVLLPDSALIALDGTALVRRASYRDAIASDTFDITQLPVALAGSRALVIDSLGAPQIVYPEIDPLAPPACLASASAGVKIRRATINADGTIAISPTALDSVYLCDVAAVAASVRTVSRRRAGGGFELDVVFERSLLTADGMRVLLDTVKLGIGPRGQVVRAAVASGRWNGGEVVVRRVSSDSLSAVAVAPYGVELVITHEIAPVPAGIAQTQPGFVVGDPPLLAWRESVDDRRRFVLSRIDADAVTAIDTVEGFDHRYTRPSTPSSIEGERTTTWAPSIRATVVMTAWEWAYSTATRTGVTFSSAKAYTADAEGWRIILDAGDRSIASDIGGAFSQAMIGTGLDLSVAAAIRAHAGRIVVRVDGPSSARDSAASPAAPAASSIVPIDRVHWALIDGDTLRVADPDRISAPIALPPADARASAWAKLDDGALLRASIAIDGRTVKAVAFDTRGTVRGRGQIALDDDATSIAIASGDDGLVRLLIETSEGIAMVTFTRALVPLGAVTLARAISDSVAAINGCVAGGMLHVGWEEVREGTSDVYGIDRPIASLGATEAPARSSHAAAIRCVSREGRLEVVTDAPGATHVWLVDVSGRTIAQQPLAPDGAALRAGFDTATLPSGVYLVIATGDGAAIATTVVVANDRR
jgi:hypothetical protein